MVKGLTTGSPELIIASAYFPGDVHDVPPLEVQRLVSYCHRSHKNFIISCDANARHTVWQSSDCNDRGERLLDYLFSQRMEILNSGGEPTFINAIRSEILDLTLTNLFMKNQVKNWHVSPKVSFSDHRYIEFEIGDTNIERESYRSPKDTNWELFKFHLEENLGGINSSAVTSEDLDVVTSQFEAAVLQAYDQSCPEKTRNIKRMVNWWNGELEKLRADARRLFNRAKRTRNWSEYHQALTKYNKAIRRSKRRTWKGYTEGISNTPTLSRLQKALAKDHTNAVGLLQLSDGRFTADREESIMLLLKVHFPDSIVIGEEEDNYQLLSSRSPTNKDYVQAGKMFNPNSVRWAIESLKPYKSPGADGIIPVLLKEAKEHILPPLIMIFRASYALGYIPRSWRNVNVVFIPKPGKPVSLPKSLRPISLTSFVLKTMEKVVDRNIRDRVLIKSPLHHRQFAYQKGRSTITALHLLVGRIEGALRAKEVALCAFLDIEGAFDNTSHDSIKEATLQKGVDSLTINWIQAMLQNRRVTAKLGDDSKTVLARRGCPQGGVLSPLLWCLVVDELLVKLTELGHDIIAFADDLVIIVRGKDMQTLCDLLQNALDSVWTWCCDKGLGVNPNKTVIVPFTRKRELPLCSVSLGGTLIQFSNQVKYLGVYLDKRLTWNAHIKNTTNKAGKAMWACKSLHGKIWGLQPKMVYWTYMAVIRPMITYAALVWWHKTNEKATQAKLSKLQRLACLGITGAMHTAPTAALEVMLGMAPLHIFVQRAAAQEGLRLPDVRKLKRGNLIGHLKILSEFEDLIRFPTDTMPTILDFEKPFKVVETTRQCWVSGGPNFPNGALLWYTDGSRMGTKAGAGIFGPRCKLSVALGNYPTVFQAELIAIDQCSQILRKRDYSGAKIYILSDSQAALKALQSYSISSKLVRDCLINIKHVALKNKVTLMWLPGHEGIEGNETADRLAKEGSESQFIGPEPYCSPASNYVRGALKDWENKKTSSYWNNCPGQRQSKLFIKLSPGKTKKYLQLSRNQLRKIVGFFTGHGPVNYHLKNIGLVDQDLCRFCKEERETGEHILCKCEALAVKRMWALGEAIMKPLQVQRLPAIRVLDFLNSIGFDN